LSKKRETKAAKAALAASLHLPAWGRMPKLHASSLPTPAPSRFRLANGLHPSPAQWSAWLDALADEMALFVWPRWTGGHWQGPATAGAEALSRVDLTLMAPLSSKLGDPVSQTSSVTHGTLFVAEDDAPPSVTGLLNYKADVSNGVLRLVPQFLREGGGIAGVVSLELKQRMQRPRPYQVAYHFDAATTFSYLPANSAVTPSLVSGHCLQGTMALANVVFRLEEQFGSPLNAGLLEALQQFFIDGGDRRVMAGVHYPSDNVSSWYSALRLCAHVFSDVAGDPAKTIEVQRRAREVIWDAVRLRSSVYAAIEAAAATAGSPYQPLTAALRAAAVGDPAPAP